MDDMNLEDWKILLHFWFHHSHEQIYKTVTTLSGKYGMVETIIEYHKKVIERLNSEL